MKKIARFIIMKGFGNATLVINLILYSVIAFLLFLGIRELYKLTGKVCLAHPLVKKELKGFAEVRIRKKYLDSLIVVLDTENEVYKNKAVQDSLNFEKRLSETQTVLSVTLSEKKYFESTLKGVLDSTLCKEKYGWRNKKVRIVNCK